MASFLTGAQISAPMTLKAPYGIDSRSTANTVEEVLTQYPVSCRYLGMKVFVEAENKFYIFSKHELDDGTMSTGLTDEDFQPFDPGSKIDIDSVLSETSENPVQNKVVTAQLETRQKKLVIGENLENSVVLDSENPITSGAVASALEGLRGQLNYKGYYATYEEMSNVIDAVLNDWCTVGSDETHDGQKSKYIYDGTQWVYNGEVAEAQVELDDTTISDSNAWSSKKINETIDKQHQSYQAGIPLVMGEMYVESHSLYRCTTDIASEDNLAFGLLPDGTMELVVGNGDIKQCEYDEHAETLLLYKLTTDSIEYNETTMTLNIFET